MKGKKTGGRVKGSQNLSTEQLRNVFQSFLQDNIHELQTAFDELDARNKLLFIEKVAKLILPPPMQDLEKLTDEQLDILINKLKKDAKPETN